MIPTLLFSSLYDLKETGVKSTELKFIKFFMIFVIEKLKSIFSNINFLVKMG